MYGDRNAWYVFIIFLVMIGLVYYVAVVKEVPVITNAFVQLGYAFSGRNSQGNYPNYAK